MYLDRRAKTEKLCWVPTGAMGPTNKVIMVITNFFSILWLSIKLEGDAPLWRTRQNRAGIVQTWGSIIYAFRHTFLGSARYFYTLNTYGAILLQN
jgi:hypothetical protein